ncbi:MAG: porin family protein [Bacteroidota bacterium]
MKKISLTLALAFGTLMSVAQNNNTIVPPDPIQQSNFSIGVTGGYGHSFLVPYRNYAFNSSWNAGIAAVYSPWVHWGVGIDALYSSEGSTFTSGDLRYKTTLGYVRVPLKAVYYFNKYENDFRPKVSLGPTLGFLVNEDNTSDASSFDLGANLSAGFNYRLLRAVWLSAEASYYQGFLDVYKENTVTDLNGNIRANIGLHFGF